MSKSVEEFQLDELKATIESLRLQVTTMEGGNALLNEELSKQAAIAMQAMSSAQVSQGLVNKHLTNANRNRLAFEKSSRECDMLKSQCLQLSQEIDSLGEHITSLNKEQRETQTRLEDKVHVLEQDLTNTRTQLDTAEKANHDLEQLNAQLHDLNDALRQHLMEATVRLEVVKEDFSQQTSSSVLDNQITQTYWEHMTVESQTQLTFMSNEDNLISCHVQTDSPLNQTLACQTDKSAICFERRIPGVSKSMQTDAPMSFWMESAANCQVVDDTSFATCEVVDDTPLSCHDSRHRMIKLKQTISDRPSVEHTRLVTDSNRDMTSSAVDDLECEHMIETSVHEECEIRQNGSSSAADPGTKNLVWFSQHYSGPKLLQSSDETSTAQYSGHNSRSHGLSLETRLATPSCSHSSQLKEDLQGLSGDVKSRLDQPEICLNNAKLGGPSQLDGASQLDSLSQLDCPSQLGSPSHLCGPSQLDCPSQLGGPSQIDCPCQPGGPSELSGPSQLDEQFERRIYSKVNLVDCNKRISRMLDFEPQLKKLRLAGDHQQFMSPMYLKPSVATTYSWDLSHRLSEQVTAKSLMTPALLAEVTVMAASRIKPIFSAVASRNESGQSNLPNAKPQLSLYSQNQPSANPQLSSHSQNQPSNNPQLASYHQHKPSTNPQFSSDQNQPSANLQLSSHKKLPTCHSNGAEKTLQLTLGSKRKLKADNASCSSHKLGKESHYSLADDKTRSRRLRLQRSSGHKKNPIGCKLKKGNLVFVPNLAGSSNTEKKIEGPLRGILKGPTRNKQRPMRCVNFPEELEIHLKGLTQESQDCAPVTDSVHVTGDELPTTKLSFQQAELETISQEFILLDSQT